MDDYEANPSESLKSFFHSSSSGFPEADMPRESTEVYEFGPYRLDVDERALLRIDGVKNGNLPEKAFQTLTILVRNHGRLVAKQELLDTVWPDSFVEENNLDKCIHAIRHVLGEKNGGGKYIETVRGHGYRFVADVKTPDGSPSGLRHQGMRPEVRSSRSVLGIGLAVVLLALLALGFGLLSSGAASSTSSQFNLSDMQRLTANDSSSHPAISPDGKFVAYVLRRPDRLSIQLMQVATRFTHRLYEPPDTRDIAWLAFSHDGNYVYFVQADPSGSGTVGVLYRIGLLAASPEPIARDIAYYALSPKSGSLAFVRYERATNESRIFVIDPDRSNERLVATRSLTEPFSFVAWAPDDRFLAAAVGSREQSGARMFPAMVDLTDGSQKEITSKRWQYLSYLHWLSDGSGLLANGIEHGSLVGAAWHISLEDGQTELLGELPSIYTIMGQTSDSKTLVAQMVELRSNIWTASLESETAIVSAKQLTTGNDGRYVTFAPDGRLLFTSTLIRPAMPDIWTMQVDGGERRRITEGPDSYGVPVFSRDGRYILFESGRSGRSNIWRIDADGSNAIQLTFGNNEKGPSVSPDGRWVYYRSPDDTTIRRVSIDGGESEVLASANWYSCIVSPDGRSCLSSYRESGDTRWLFGLLDLTTGRALRLFSFPEGVEPGMGYEWMPDGTAFIYAANKEGESNIWKQPVDGGPAVQLTDLTSGEDLYSPAVSPDGKRLAFCRGSWTYDVFLIRNFHWPPRK